MATSPLRDDKKSISSHQAQRSTTYSAWLSWYRGPSLTMCLILSFDTLILYQLYQPGNGLEWQSLESIIPLWNDNNSCIPAFMWIHISNKLDCDRWQTCVLYYVESTKPIPTIRAVASLLPKECRRFETKWKMQLTTTIIFTCITFKQLQTCILNLCLFSFPLLCNIVTLEIPTRLRPPFQRLFCNSPMRPLGP